jgi:hypothetical protein
VPITTEVVSSIPAQAKIIFFPILGGGRRVRPHLDPPLHIASFEIGHDRMVVGFTTTYAISAYHP